VSIATTDPNVAREIEPTVAPPVQRLKTVERLASAGIRTGVLLAPILPGLTDCANSLEAAIRAAHDHGAHFVGHSVLHLGHVTRDAFFAFLRGRRPDLVPLYQRLYAGKYASSAYPRAVSELVTDRKSRERVAHRPHICPPAEPEQIALPEDQTDREEGNRPGCSAPGPVRMRGSIEFES
jgi:DNA repair photolyase